jgi:SAM-dependent methyltransferase
LFLALSWDVYFSESAGHILALERSFYGTLRIQGGSKGVMHALLHGNTIHGMQISGDDPRKRRIPLTYYFPTGPMGLLFGSYEGTDILRSVGIVGLGVGSLAAYPGRGQEVTFYEIDPAIERVARNPQWFTFLRDSEGRGVKVKTVIGDARLRLQEAPDQSYGVLVVDAFSGDSIPTHLLTEEALRLYLSKLKPNGILAFNISNTYLDLEPVLGNIAAKLGQTAYVWNDRQISEQDFSGGKYPSSWLVMAPSKENFQKLLPHGKWRPCRTVEDIGIWTDDQFSLLSVLQW